MSKQGKKLLNEDQARRWMKLANISNLSEQFVKERYEEEEGKHKEEESVHRASEGAKLSQTPVKQGGNKTMAQESVHKEEEGMHKEEESIHENMPEETPPEAPVGDTGHEEPDGDEPVGGEPMIADLVKAIADAITAQTGVAVDVEGSAGGEEGGEEGHEMEPPAEEPMPGTEKPEAGMEETSRLHQLAKAKQKYGHLKQEEVDERKGHRDHAGTHYDHDGEPMQENKGKLKEEFSEAPKVTKQNQSAQGSVKDPYKSQVKVQGVEKPESMGSNHYPHKMKALEEQLMKRVYARIMEDLKKVKEAAVKENKKPASKPATKK